MDELMSYVSDETFAAELAATSVPMLLDFTADWCEPCKAMEPAMEQIAREYAGRLRVVRVDLDSSEDLAFKFRVMSIPTLIFLKDGEPGRRVRGAQSYDNLVNEIDAFFDES